MSRLGTRDDIATYRQYLADIVDSSRLALDIVDPAPFFVEHGESIWAAMSAYLAAATATAAAPVIAKYSVLAAADLCTASTTFQVMQSIRLDLATGRRSTVSSRQTCPNGCRPRFKFK